MTAPLEKRKIYPARIFKRASVVCPSCLQRFKDAHEQCPRCGFDALRAVEQFAFTPPVMERVMDQVGVIDDGLKKEIDAAVLKVQKRFPQVDFHFCIAELDDPIKLPELGFWMMNACLLRDGQVESDRAWSMLVLIDVKRGLVSITPGYAIEAFFEDSGWENILRELSEDLAAGDYRAAIIYFLKSAECLLLEAALQVKQKIRKVSS